jgi:hypothetical protein
MDVINQDSDCVINLNELGNRSGKKYKFKIASIYII